MQCTNNLKQLGLAIQNYADVYNATPAARIEATNISVRRSNDGDYWSGTFAMLPFMEQQALYDAARDDAKKNNRREPQHCQALTANPAPSGFRCPSDGNGDGKYAGSTGSFNKNNYITSRGDIGVYVDEHSWSSERNWSVMSSSAERAGFGPFTYKSLAAITDGTSNTVAMSETVTGTSSSDKRIKAAYATNVGVALSSFLTTCLSYYSSDDINVYTSGVETVGARGAVLFDGRATFGGFCTILPPNSPSCSRMSYLTRAGVFSATSNHSGGVNAVFFDGSVRFISETIDAGTTAMHSYPKYGKSDYGVWGAMGSTNGGETATSL